MEFNQLSEGKQRDRRPFASKYNNFLLRVARRRQQDQSIAQAIDYQMQIERGHLAFG